MLMIESWDYNRLLQNTWIQYNDGSNNFGASINLTYDNDSGLFTVRTT